MDGPARMDRDGARRVGEPPPTTGRAQDAGPARALRMVSRALARRCPSCGAGSVFRSYLHQRETCGGCGLRLDRGEPDFFIGAYTINLIVAEVLVVVSAMGVALWTWPEVPWTALTWGLAGLMVVAPIALYPWSRQLWLACDLVFQPPQAKDFAGRGNPAGKRG